MLNFSVENPFDILEEIKPLIEEHWEEIALNKDKVKLSPDWRVYEELNNQNRFLFVTARDVSNARGSALDSRSNLVGYSAYVLLPQLLHYTTVSAAESDIFWLHPEYRKGTAGIRLLKYAEEVLKEIGYDMILTRTKLGEKDVGSVLERLGYNPIERVYSKWLS